MNSIVYLGTGSGKTFIAIMLIKHMRGELGRYGYMKDKYMDRRIVRYGGQSKILTHLFPLNLSSKYKVNKTSRVRDTGIKTNRQLH